MQIYIQKLQGYLIQNLKVRSTFFSTLQPVIELKDAQENSSEMAEAYCKKLKDLIEKENGEKKILVCTRLNPSAMEARTVDVWMYGDALERLFRLCGNNLKVTIEYHLYNKKSVRIKAEEMAIFSKEMISKSEECAKVAQEILVKHGYVIAENDGFCYNFGIPLPDNFVDAYNTAEWVTGGDVLHAKRSIYFSVEEDYINHDPSTPSKFSNMCKTILSKQLDSDLSIVASNGMGLAANKCFISFHSPVLAKMMEEKSEDSTANMIVIKTNVSEDCVKAALEYMYTLDITLAQNNCDVAVELLQFACKFEIPQLELKVATMLSQRICKWYKVNGSVKLFRFVRNIEKYEEIKRKMILVLKTKGGLLMQAEEYKKIFVEDVETAMEMCSMALSAE